MKIDAHNHVYPTRYMEALEHFGPAVGIEIRSDSGGLPAIFRNGARAATITPPMMDINLRLRDMDKANVDIQVLTTSIPGAEVFPREIGIKIASLQNDEIAAICKAHPDRFIGFGTVYYPDMEAALEEAARCVEELGFRGFTIGSHINGQRIDDIHMHPFYTKMCEYNLPLHLHPRPPLDKESYKEYDLGALIGFEIEVCIAVLRLVFSGVLEKYADLKIIVSHLGAGVTFLSERVQFGNQHYADCQNITKTAKHYLQKLYYDSVNCSEESIHPAMCTYAFAGADHMVFGTDYPHVLGDIHQMVHALDSMPITADERRKIYSGNMLNLLNM